MFSPKLLLAAHATEVFKAVASDPNATEDTKDPVRQADHNEDKLDKVENQLFSSQTLLKMGWWKFGEQKNGMIGGKNGMMGGKNGMIGGKKWGDGWQTWQKTGWQTNT